jgi:ferredoxin-NADP reductase
MTVISTTKNQKKARNYFNTGSLLIETIFSCRNNNLKHNKNKNKNKNNNLFISIAFITITITITITIAIIISISVSLLLYTFDSSNNNADLNNNMQNFSAGAAAISVVSATVSPYVKQSYKLLQKTKLSHDSFLLRYGLPTNNKERKFLGTYPSLPTCIKIDYNYNNSEGEDENEENDEETKTKSKKTNSFLLSKSYSPISHPSQSGYFDLIVKSYETTSFENGGGVGKYLCNMNVGDSIKAELKKERIMHGSSQILNRGWNNIGLIAGGTGIAPLLQLARILLEQEQDQEQNNQNASESIPKIYLLFINCTKRDILGKNEIDLLQQKYPNNFFVTYSFTQEEEQDDEDEDEDEQDDDDDEQGNNGSTTTASYVKGRGDVNMALSALPPPPPPPTDSDTDTDTTESNNDTMIFICGRDGFVSHWAGPVTRGPPPPGKKKGPKIQGPLLGVLKDAGYNEKHVFKY